MHGVSRKTAYKWIERYRDGGLDALADRTHAPARAGPTGAAGRRGAPPRLPPRPTRRGGRANLLLYLAKRHPHAFAPRPEYGRGSPHPPWADQEAPPASAPEAPRLDAPLVAEQPNAVWTPDYKGQFKIGNGEYCYPLTVGDGYTRFILRLSGAHPPSSSTRR